MRLKNNEYPWDFKKTYHYALSLIARRTYSTSTLKKKVLIKTNNEIAQEVLLSIEQQQLLNDTNLCLNTSLMWIQKKPLSYVQLHKKLASYGFGNDDIQHTVLTLSTMYKNHELNIIGSFPVLEFEFIKIHKINFSLWNILAFTSVLLMYNSNSTLSNTTIQQRLHLRGHNEIHKVIQAFELYKGL